VADRPVCAANLGMGMLSVQGITEVCEFVRDTLKAQNKRVAHTVMELEIMQLSTLPAAGDIEIVEEYRKGTFDDVPRKYYDASTVWDQDTGGTVTLAENARKASGVADWEKRRAREVLETYEGKVQMDEKSVETWSRGISALSEVSDTIVAVIHPILCMDLPDRRQIISPNHFTDIVARLSEQTGIRIMLDTDFVLESEDFRDINHMSNQGGRQKFSTQIAETLFGQTARRN